MWIDYTSKREEKHKKQYIGWFENEEKIINDYLHKNKKSPIINKSKYWSNEFGVERKLTPEESVFYKKRELSHQQELFKEIYSNIMYYRQIEQEYQQNFAFEKTNGIYTQLPELQLSMKKMFNNDQIN